MPTEVVEGDVSVGGNPSLTFVATANRRQSEDGNLRRMGLSSEIEAHGVGVLEFGASLNVVFGGEAVRADDAFDIPVEVLAERADMGLGCVGGGECGVGVGEQEIDVFVAVDFFVNGIKAVNDGFELRRESIIIDWRGKDDDVGIENVLSHEGEIVFLTA